MRIHLKTVELVLGPVSVQRNLSTMSSINSDRRTSKQKMGLFFHSVPFFPKPFALREAVLGILWE